jgi:hypothetical protein
MRKITIAIAAIALLTLASCEHYSDGNRAGVIQKFSKKGVVNKTWEGELMMSTPGVIGATAWEFSVEDQAVADSINAHLSERVEVTYHQVYHFKNLGKYRGETDYFVTAVKPIK